MVRQDSHLHGCSTADSKGLADAFFVTADGKGLTRFWGKAEKVGVRREAGGGRRKSDPC